MPATLQWTPEEDEMLRELVEVHGAKAWAKIASVICTKGSKQCRRRWKNFINMSAKTCTWSQEEDATLIDAHRRLGNRWTEISRIFGDRTDNAVKNRWHALIRKHPELDGNGGADDSEGAAPRAKRRRTTRGGGGSAGAGTSEEWDDSDLLDSARNRGHSGLQRSSGLNSSGGVSAAAMPTPFDQAHSMALHQQAQQAMAVAVQYVAQQQQQLAAAAQAQAQAATQQQWQWQQLNWQQPAGAPLQIMVTKDFLTPWEQQLADEINAMKLPVHVEVATQPLPPDVSLLPPDSLPLLPPDVLTAGRDSWKQYANKVDEPGDSRGLQELLGWFGSSGIAAANGSLAPGAGDFLKEPSGLGGRRLTRSLSKGSSGSGSLAGDHRQLLVKLMSRGLEARSSSEDAIAAAAAAAGANGVPQQQPGGGGGPPPRCDPLKRTRSANNSDNGRSSSKRSRDMELAAAAAVQEAGQRAAAAAGHTWNRDGFRNPFAPAAALGGNNNSGGGGRPPRGPLSSLLNTSMSMPLIEPTPLCFDRSFSESRSSSPPRAAPMTRRSAALPLVLALALLAAAAPALGARTGYLNAEAVGQEAMSHGAAMEGPDFQCPIDMFEALPAISMEGPLPCGDDGRCEDLTGKVALITGGSTGIGRGAADRLAKAGMQVVATSRTPEIYTGDCETYQQPGDKCKPVGFELWQLDQTDQASVDALIQKVADKYGRIDLLFLNAGRGYRYPIFNNRLALGGQVWNYTTCNTLDAIVLTTDTNVWGPIRVLEAALPLLPNEGYARVILTSSVDSWVAPSGSIAYSASKRSINALAEEWMAENYPSQRANVKVTALHPGNTQTDVYRHVIMPKCPGYSPTLGLPFIVAMEKAQFTSIPVLTASDAGEALFRLASDPQPPRRVGMVPPEDVPFVYKRICRRWTLPMERWTPIGWDRVDPAAAAAPAVEGGARRASLLRSSARRSAGDLGCAADAMARVAVLLALLALIEGSRAAAESMLPAGYDCDCSERANCACPATAAPGGLAPEEVPQFILFTHDDAIFPTTDRAFRAVCDGRRNPDGCPFRATMFTQAAETDCQLAAAMHADGYEIATHTANHTPMPAGYPFNDTIAEIMGAKRFLSEECGIPAADIRGFRNPYLKTNPLVRRALHEHGFLFDSTLLEGPDTESISTSMANRAWPYTLDFGVAQNCDWFSDTQQCNGTERWPGLWEVPLWILSVLNLEFTMDVGYYGGRGVYEPLMEAFDLAYNGNRAPLPIYVHTTWVDKNPSRIDELQRFADYTLSKPDVFWVTMSQLIDWMKNPKSVSELRASGGAMCKRAAAAPFPAPRALPRDGANVTLTLRGTAVQVRDQQAGLEAAVRALLGGGGAQNAVAPFVAALSYAPTDPSLVPPSPPVASGLEVQSEDAGGSWHQFEGPPHSGFALTSSDGGREPAGTVSAASMDGAGASSDAQGAKVQVTLAAAGADPFALYAHASQPSKRSALASQLTALGLGLVGDPAVVPIKDRAVAPLPSPPAPPAQPAAAPAPAPAAPSEQPAPDVGAAAAPAAPVMPRDDAGEQQAAAAGAGASSGGGGGGSGLSAGAIAGIVAGGAVALAAAALLAVRWQRRRRTAEAAAGVAAEAADRDGLPGSVAVSSGSRLRRREGAAGPVRVQALAVGWVVAGAALAGVLVGLAVAKAAQAHFSREFDPQVASIENARLRAKVEELQQMVTKFEPLAYKTMQLRFTKGVNKSVILGLVDELLSRKEVNIWWLPDSIERMLYLNVMTLMLSVLDEIVDGMSMNFAGHNVKMTLAYLDLGEEGAPKPGGGGGGGKKLQLLPRPAC
ncbi:Myb-related B isoform A [Micractinium conductrix]|uniref:Myb-related B isoform A n=1 Tax=Micractinium conductrix TaxID=554055 RepID=A0A2P6VK97_9CHLO|nr:Myb-related B isoform A [Micractinium conductrix]|eukprot:PSC74519.1 Myb-related B isoform A [Micractinium conductrix]